MSLRIRIGGGPVPLSVTNPAAVHFGSGAILLAGDINRTTIRQRAQLEAAALLPPYGVGRVSAPLLRATSTRTLGPIRYPLAGFRTPYNIPAPPRSSPPPAPAPAAPKPKGCEGC